MNKYDQIEVLEKGVDEIEVVEKFNPFHDAQGRFSNKNGFKSYSANPNTRAGAMAIARSAAAGHMNTVNVHRDAQATGATIRANANWLGQGHQQTRSQTGAATLNRRVEPAAGLAGASATGASWQYQNAQQGRKTSPGKQPAQQQQAQQQPQKPAAQKPAQPKPQQQKPAQQAQQKPANDRKPVDGKDISASFQYDRTSKKSAMDQVTEQQGFKNKPQVIKDRAEFSAAVKDSGIMGYRTFHQGQDVVTGKTKTGTEFADDLKNSNAFSHNGSGGQAYGSGIYVATTSNPKQGVAPGRSSTNSAKQDSKMYGYGNNNDYTAAITLAKNAKIGDYNKVSNDFSKMTYSQRARFGGELGAYAASKGYDALRAVNAGWNCDYTIVYNRSKLIIFEG